MDRVLNHRGIVNAETERKVLEIAKLLDYQPNKAGIALAAQKKKLKLSFIKENGGVSGRADRCERKYDDRESSGICDRGT